MRLLEFALPAMLTLALAACANPDAGSVVVLDEADIPHMSRALQGALESNKSGQSANWTNPDNNHRGAVTPLRTFKSETGQDCREFQRLITIADQTGFAYGTACRQPNGTWRVVSTTTTSYYDRGPRYGGYAGFGSGFGHYGYPYYHRYSYGYYPYRSHFGSRFSFGFGHSRYY